jgi:hypothetical protein
MFRRLPLRGSWLGNGQLRRQPQIHSGNGGGLVNQRKRQVFNRSIVKAKLLHHGSSLTMAKRRGFVRRIQPLTGQVLLLHRGGCRGSCFQRISLIGPIAGNDPRQPELKLLDPTPGTSGSIGGQVPRIVSHSPSPLDEFRRRLGRKSQAICSARPLCGPVSAPPVGSSRVFGVL